MIGYLNEVLANTSRTNRNNTRTDLSSLFQTMVDNEIIDYNFIKGEFASLGHNYEREKLCTVKLSRKLILCATNILFSVNCKMVFATSLNFGALVTI